MVAKENEGVILEAWEQEEQIRIDKAVKVRNCRVYAICSVVCLHSVIP